jgi:hypothetical protein
MANTTPYPSQEPFLYITIKQNLLSRTGMTWGIESLESTTQSGTREISACCVMDPVDAIALYRLIEANTGLDASGAICSVNAASAPTSSCLHLRPSLAASCISVWCWTYQICLSSVCRYRT